MESKKKKKNGSDESRERTGKDVNVENGLEDRGRQILNHCATREVPRHTLNNKNRFKVNGWEKIYHESTNKKCCVTIQICEYIAKVIVTRK